MILPTILQNTGITQDQSKKAANLGGNLTLQIHTILFYKLSSQCPGNCYPFTHGISSFQVFRQSSADLNRSLIYLAPDRLQLNDVVKYEQPNI
ncbi:hypothetical protein A8708_03400 [Paenibacillus oryzisoli]|uniref:Uncharacterized protein n=1 Tax=Paenibacillus oryzisoli TaxID=1850517 RepID=A0A198A2E9_9BACL|nr:hypothetical protein A8708_03400 [Paenibacillus oryzisoli]